MTNPRLASILARHDLTPSQREGLERDIGELVKPGASVVALVEAYGRACASEEFELTQHPSNYRAARATTASSRKVTAKSALLAAIAAPAIDSARPSWGSMPNGLHEMWWALDVYRNGDRELYAIVKERDDCPTATWAVSAQGDGDDHAVLAEGVADSADAAQLAAESALRTIARGISAAIAAVPGEVVPPPFARVDRDEHGNYVLTTQCDWPDRSEIGTVRIDTPALMRDLGLFLVAFAQAEGRGE